MNDAETKAWADSLKVGDEVVINGRTERIGKVTRTTPAQVRIEGTAFWKKDGRQVGQDVWTYNFIQPITPEARARIIAARRLQDARNKFCELSRSINGYSVEQLEAAIAALKPKEIFNGTETVTNNQTETPTA